MEKRNNWENQVRLMIIISLLFVIVLLLLLIFSKKGGLFSVGKPKSVFPTAIPTEKWTKKYINSQIPDLNGLKKCAKYSFAPTSDRSDWGEITKIEPKAKKIYIKGQAVNLRGFEGTQVYLTNDEEKPKLNEEANGMLLALPYSVNEVLSYLQIGATVKITNGPFGKILRVYCR
jgi:hypothetical protein